MKKASALICGILAVMTALSGCAVDSAPEAEPTNLGDAMFMFDGLTGSESASMVIGGTEYIFPEDSYPIFMNGNVLTDGASKWGLACFYYDGVTEPKVDLMAFVKSAFGYSDVSRGADSWIIRYKTDAPAAHEVISPSDCETLILNINSDTAQAGNSKITLSSANIITTRSDGQTTIMMNCRDISEAFGLEVHFYDSADCDAWMRDEDTGEVLQSNGSPYYTSGTPHLMYWDYPDGAAAMTPEEATDAVRAALIEAYEANFGEYIPLAPDEYDTTESGLYNRWIQELTLKDENDRFYRFSFVYDFLIDKYTGDILTQYNGMSEVFKRFDPLSPTALAFAG